MIPQIGQIVLYKLADTDATQINKRRDDFNAAPPQNSGLVAHIGNRAVTGDIFPAVIVRTFGASTVQLQVFLDGNDTFWATSVAHAKDLIHYSPDNLHPQLSWIWPNEASLDVSA